MICYWAAMPCLHVPGLAPSISHEQNSQLSRKYLTRSVAVLGGNLCGCLILLKSVLPSEIEPGFWCAV